MLKQMTWLLANGYNYLKTHRKIIQNYCNKVSAVYIIYKGYPESNLRVVKFFVVMKALEPKPLLHVHKQVKITVSQILAICEQPNQKRPILIDAKDLVSAKRREGKHCCAKHDTRSQQTTG